MKKNKILYLIFTLITVFSFTTTVSAAQEFTCLFEKPAAHDKVLLIQYSDGTQKIFKNHSKKAEIEDEGWYGAGAIPKVSENGEIIEMKDLETPKTSCPQTLTMESDGGVVFYYSDEGKLDLYSEPLLSVKEPSTKTVISSVEDGDKYATKCDDIGNDNIGYENMWFGTDNDTIYTGSCLYYKDINLSWNYEIVDGTAKNDGCHVIRLDLSATGVQVSEYDPDKEEGSTRIEYSKTPFDIATFKISDNLNQEFVTNTGGNCPLSIKVERKVGSTGGQVPKNTIDTLVGDKKKGEMYYLAAVRGKNPLTNEPLRKNDEIKFNYTVLEIESCSDLLGEDLLEKLKTIYNVLKISIPLLVIGLGIMDFSSAIFAGNEDKMKKSSTKFIKRLVIAVIIFLIPTILSLILDIAHNIWGDRIGNDICDIVFK